MKRVDSNPENSHSGCKHMRRIWVNLPNTDKRVATYNPDCDGVHVTPFGDPDAYKYRMRYVNTRKEEMFVPCGHCVDCKRQKSNEWNARLQYEWNAFVEDKENNPNPKRLFVTLTFDDVSKIPHIDGTQENERNAYSYVQSFLKRLRNNPYFTIKFRYFCVGEFGSVNHRLHFHLLLFISDASSLPDYITTSALSPERQSFYDSFLNGDTNRKQLDIHRYLAKKDGVKSEWRYTTGVESTLSFLFKNFLWYEGGQEYRETLSAFTKGLIVGTEQYAIAVESAKSQLSLGFVQCMEVRGDSINGYVTKYLTKSNDNEPIEFESFHRQSARLGEAYFCSRYFEPIRKANKVPETIGELMPFALEERFNDPITHKDAVLLMSDIFYTVPKVIHIDAKGKEIYPVKCPRWWYRKYSNRTARIMEFNEISRTLFLKTLKDHSQKYTREDEYNDKLKVIKARNEWLNGIPQNADFDKTIDYETN